MVLDVLFPPRRVLREPWLIALAAALFVFAGATLELLMPSLHASALVFAMVPAIPLVWALLMHEERAEENACYRYASPLAGERKFLECHERLILVFAWFFLGSLVAYCALYSFLPDSANNAVFKDQLNEVKLIQGYASQTARVFSEAKFWTLFSHNLTVLALMFVFCLVYGVGSIYLLLWNASIIGVVIGTKVRAEGAFGFLTGFLGLFPHGIFEVAAYFIASIAGGVISMAVSRVARGKCPKREVPLLAMDTIVLAVVALALLAVGSAIESSY
jgi:uncharacterized membrane protein SpoIIM required for sporulation